MRSLSRIYEALSIDSKGRLDIICIMTKYSVILIHSVGALVAMVLAIAIYRLPKGTRWHRWLGRSFVIFMGASVLSSFAILGSGGLSVLHLLSLLSVVWIARGVYMVKVKPRNWLFHHVNAMGSAFIALLIAGCGVLGRHLLQGTGIHWTWFMGVGAVTIMPIFSYLMLRFKQKLIAKSQFHLDKSV